MWMSSYMGVDAKDLDCTDTGLIRITNLEDEISYWGWLSWGVERVPAPNTEIKPKTTLTEGTSGTEENEITLLFGGDMILHEGIVNEAEVRPKTDFSFLFKQLAPELQTADLVVANLDGILSNPPYSYFPRFKGPKEFARALSTAGFDVVVTANNHAFDFGIEGLKENHKYIEEAGLQAIGTRANLEQESYQIFEIEGIKVGLTAFTYETERLRLQKNPEQPTPVEERRTLNTHPFPPRGELYLDSFAIDPRHPELIKADSQKLKERAQELREAGANILVFYMHWGQEYWKDTTAVQDHYAKVLAEAGVDLIIGSHPHVVQEAAILPSSSPSGRTICYYSLGNLVADQPNRKADGLVNQGALAKITLSRDSDGVAKVKEAKQIPILLRKSYPKNQKKYRCYLQVIPLEEMPLQAIPRD